MSNKARGIVYGLVGIVLVGVMVAIPQFWPATPPPYDHPPLIVVPDCCQMCCALGGMVCVIAGIRAYRRGS